ncbi:MAG: hypothetical protein ABW104_01660 [Candidatus Thiodiazotropha sp. 6PLUC2]
MKIIKDELKLRKLFGELSNGGMSSYKNSDQALVYVFESNGGPFEDATLYLKFVFTEFFQMPLAIDSVNVQGYAIDEFRSITKEECESFIHKEITNQMDFSSNYKCFRFYANGAPSQYYIYSAYIEGWVKPDSWKPPLGYELW